VTERNFIPAARRRYNELFENLIVKKSDGLRVKILKLDKIEGDISMYNKKGKTVLIYDFIITVKWDGSCKKDGKSYKGKGTMKLEVDINDYSSFEVDMESENSNNAILKEIMASDGYDLFKEKN